MLCARSGWMQRQRRRLRDDKQRFGRERQRACGNEEKLCSDEAGEAFEEAEASVFNKERSEEAAAPTRKALGIYDEQPDGLRSTCAFCLGRKRSLAAREWSRGSDGALPGEEIAIKTITDVVQGYLELSKKMRASEIQKKISFLSRSHLELRRGSREEARKYCLKKDTRIAGPWAFGAISADPAEKLPDTNGSGKRNDLTEICQKVLAGTKVESLKDDLPHMLVKYSKGLRFLEMCVAKTSVPNWRKLSVIVIWGPTGTGKTRKAIEMAGADFYMLSKVCYNFLKINTNNYTVK